MVVFGRVWRFSGMERWRKSGEAGGGLKALRSSIFFCREGSTTQKINNVHGDVNAVPEQSLQHLGWATAGINPEEFFNITFSEVDTIAALGQFHGLDGKQRPYVNMIGTVLDGLGQKHPRALHKSQSGCHDNLTSLISLTFTSFWG
uniref:Uncharacterized protein n=1 Tax=Timema bartmani TaxID=61472 RepID=A0A7R9FCW7_9NEOP|nr:unnamed protein product [Timema bartmani]